MPHQVGAWGGESRELSVESWMEAELELGVPRGDAERAAQGSETWRRKNWRGSVVSGVVERVRTSSVPSP